MLERREFRLPIRPKLGRHAAPHEGPAHGRGLTLELPKLSGVFRRQRLGDGGKELRYFHDRALEPAKRGRKRGGILLALRLEPEQAPAGDAGRHASDIGADFAITERAGAEPVLLLVGLAVV